MRTYIIVLFYLLTTIAFGQNSKFNSGLKAFNNKEFKKALKIMKPYADSGNSIAQYITGYCYSNKDLKVKNDSIAEYYLLKSANKKYGSAMGLLAALYFSKSIQNPKYKIDALVWSEMAASYDPLQKATTTRILIRKYMSTEELNQVADILKEKKKKFTKIDLEGFKSTNELNFVKDKASEKTKIPEDNLKLIKNPYKDWVFRWKYESFECDTMYYTKHIDSTVINSTISQIESKDAFNLSVIYRGQLTKPLKLSVEEKQYLIQELNKLKDHSWDIDIFPNSRRLDDHIAIETTFNSIENLPLEKAIYTCAIVYTFSRPIYLRDNNMALFLDQKRYRGNITQLSFNFYHFENNRWKLVSEVYSYYEHN